MKFNFFERRRERRQKIEKDSTKKKFEEFLLNWTLNHVSLLPGICYLYQDETMSDGFISRAQTILNSKGLEVKVLGDSEEPRKN